MTEKLFTGTLNHNQNKNKKKRFKEIPYYFSIYRNVRHPTLIPNVKTIHKGPRMYVSSTSFQYCLDVIDNKKCDTRNVMPKTMGHFFVKIKFSRNW